MSSTPELKSCLVPGFIPSQKGGAIRLPTCVHCHVANSIHTIIRTTIGQYYVNQAVTRGLERAAVHPGSVTFIQRFGSAINVNLHFHCVFMEGVYVDRTAQGLRPRFVQGESPTDADIAAVVQKISRRVIRKLRRLGHLETGMEAPLA